MRKDVLTRDRIQVLVSGITDWMAHMIFWSGKLKNQYFTLVQHIIYDQDHTGLHCTKTEITLDNL